MSTPLHGIEALVSLVETAEGPARDWAASRLAVMAPEQYSRFPVSTHVPDVVVAAAPPRLADSLIEALGEEAPCPPALASAVAVLGSYGALPQDPGPLAAAARGALKGDGSDADAWLVLGLAHLGEVERGDLRAVATNTTPAGRLALSTAVLLLATAEGQLDEAAAAVAGELRRVAHAEQGLLQAVLSSLGCPAGATDWPTRDPREAAWAGCTAGGGALPELDPPRGSARRRTQAWVRHLLAGVEGPAAALLRAAFAHDPHPSWGLSMVGVAGWLRTFQQGDPLDDVLQHFAGADARVLTAARRAVGPEHRDRLVESLRTRPDPALGAVALELLRATPDDADLASAIVGLLADHRALDIRAEASAAVAAWRCPERIPTLLRDPLALPLGLLVAEWIPTEEVLAALLALDLPADPDARYQYAMCLASMGDHAAVPRLSALVEVDAEGALEPVRALVSDLLRVEL